MTLRYQFDLLLVLMNPIFKFDKKFPIICITIKKFFYKRYPSVSNPFDHKE